mmetsp:Transcript_36499/g.91325  ORF Transcript_36499/g.91325 Transcript_36499/m.91325 type:complete len:236 (+) Transcript_36499:211-918(+)
MTPSTKTAITGARATTTLSRARILSMGPRYAKNLKIASLTASDGAPARHCNRTAKSTRRTCGATAFDLRAARRRTSAPAMTATSSSSSSRTEKHKTATTRKRAFRSAQRTARLSARTCAVARKAERARALRATSLLTQAPSGSPPASHMIVSAPLSMRCRRPRPTQSRRPPSVEALENRVLRPWSGLAVERKPTTANTREPREESVCLTNGTWTSLAVSATQTSATSLRPAIRNA